MNKRLAEALYHHRNEALCALIDSEFMRGRLTVSGERCVNGKWERVPISDHTSYVIDWPGKTPPSGYDDAPCAFRRELRMPKSFEDWRAQGEVRQEDQLRLARDQDLPNAASQPAPGTVIKVPTRTVINDEDRDPEIAWLIQEWVADPVVSLVKRHGEEIQLEVGNFVRRHWEGMAPPSTTRATAQQALDRYLGNGGDVRKPLVQRHLAQEAAALPEDGPRPELGDIYRDLTITEADWKRLVKAVNAKVAFPAALRVSNRITESALKQWYEKRLDGGAQPDYRKDFAAAKAKYDNRVTQSLVRAVRKNVLEERGIQLKTGPRPKMR